VKSRSRGVPPAATTTGGPRGSEGVPKTYLKRPKIIENQKIQKVPARKKPAHTSSTKLRAEKKTRPLRDHRPHEEAGKRIPLESENGGTRKKSRISTGGIGEARVEKPKLGPSARTSRVGAKKCGGTKRLSPASNRGPPGARPGVHARNAGGGGGDRENIEGGTE